MDHVERVALVFAVRAGHDAEVARLRIDRAQAPIGAGVQPAMSSPTVQIFQPGIEAGGISIARFVLPQADGNARGDVVRFALRVLDADDEHVLGQPAFVARLPARDAQCVTLLAEQRVAAVARAEALDRELFRESA